MLTLLHYLPYLLLAGLGLLALAVMFGDGGGNRSKNTRPQKVKQHYTWTAHHPRRD